jgi:hypothetical protein
MKRTVILILLLFAFIAGILAQSEVIQNKNLVVSNPDDFPHGINIDVDFPNRWAREFNFTHSKTKNVLSFGAYGEGNQLNYGYIGGGVTSYVNFRAPWMVFLPSGNIGIGTIAPSAKLDVNGTIRAKEVKIEATGWADFVFDNDYKLSCLSEVEQHIKEHKHLPGIPSEQEVLENGINVAEMQIKLLQKIEELTLYVIDLKKENEGLQERVQQLENK